MSIGPPGTCRESSCRARFQWAISAKGRRTPVDMDPAPNGNLRLRGRVGVPPDAIVLAGVELAEARAAGEPLYLAHFVTCPARASFRRRR